jgi:TonB-dependent starch-binding outer membrane protein SusC
MKLNLYLKRLFFITMCFGAFSFQSFAQSKKVTGKVTDTANGEGIPGVSIAVKGTSKGAVSDANGAYSVDASGQDVLVFSFVGYTSQEAVVGSRSIVNIGLSTDVSTLEEVVVTGYAAQQKRDITGSVVVVDTKDMVKLAGSNFVDQLQGKVSGVQMSTSGDPGSSAFVRIRGIGTINNNEPLYVIDGVPVQNESNMNFLNPNDIESMQVLKDAASASIYGSRAANGVIVITTKKGKAGNSKLNIDVFTGMQQPGSTPKMLNPSQFMEVQQKLAAGQGIPFTSSIYLKEGANYVLPDFAVRGLGGFKSGAPEADPSKYYLNPDPTGAGAADYLILKTNKIGTNWFNEVFNQAPMNSVQVSTSGGSEKGNFYVSGNVYDHQGIMIFNEYKRYQVRANSTFNIKKRIRVGENLNVAYQTTRGSQGNANEGSPLIGTYGMPQLVPVYDIKNNFASPANFNSNVSNPVAQQARSVNNYGHGMRITGNIFAELDILPDLTFKTSYGMDYGSGPSQFYDTRRYEATEGNTNPNRLEKKYYLNRNWVFFNTLSYKKKIGGHAFNALAGIEAKAFYYEGYNAGGSKLAFGDNPNYRVLRNVDPKTYFMDSYAGESTVQSQFVQAGYSLNDKYLASATIRRDGSSRFINNKYGVFPSASVGWRISKESFMSEVPFITDLKIKASYGILGNNEVGGDYPGFSNFGTSPGTSSYGIGGSPSGTTAGFDQNSIGNPDLKWETTAITNIGFDAVFAKNFDVNFEVFSRQTKDMLYNVELPLELGYIGRQAQNIGSMSNKGIDLGLNYHGIGMGNKLTYNVGVTGSTYKNEVLALEANSNTFIRSAGSRIGDITITKAGAAISQFYGYQVDGLWKSEADIASVLKTDKGGAQVGRFKYVDINKDGKIGAEDEINLGSPLPKFMLGLNLSANYMNFDATAYLSGVYGNKIFNFVKYFSHFNAFQRSRAEVFLTEAGKTLPILDGGDNYSSQRNSYFVEDGSFTRLKNLQFGYTLPSNLISKAGMSKLRVYVQGQNLFTFSKYSGLDPDVTVSNITEGYNSQRDLSLGVDFGRIPLSKSFIFGANIEF